MLKLKKIIPIYVLEEGVVGRRTVRIMVTSIWCLENIASWMDPFR